MYLHIAMSPLKKMYIIVYYGVSTYQRRILYIVKVPIVHQMWKPPIISVRLDSLKCVQIFIFSKSQIFTGCTEIV